MLCYNTSSKYFLYQRIGDTRYQYYGVNSSTTMKHRLRRTLVQ